MERIKEGLSSISTGFSNSFSGSNLIICILVSVALILVIKYCWDNYINPYLNASYVSNKEFIDKDQGEGGSGVAEIYFFYTEWCPHCKTAKPIWNSLKNEYKDKSIKNITINFIEVDCEKDTASANKFNVEGYPTIKLVWKDDRLMLSVDSTHKRKINGVIHSYSSTKQTAFIEPIDVIEDNNNNSSSNN